MILLNFLIVFPFCFLSKHIIYHLSLTTPFLLIVISCLDIYKYTTDKRLLTSATNKLKNNANLTVVGITGSNGKTSVKEILNKLLSTKFNVITTQKNQNTPKGAIIAINNFLQNDTDVFICEMGARNIGDINEICNLVNPNIGIITSVNPQHLETFKTEQNVYLAKKELSTYLNENYCVYNIDNNYVKQMFDEKSGNKSSISINSVAELFASNIHIINFHTYFDINYKGNIYPCHTSLLGEHNVTNILLALNVALRLGIDINQAIQTIINLTPTPHRLEYIKSHIDIIDDSYNCSIDSAKMALKVLSKVSKTKVVCTPGIIEGGKHQFALNQQLSSILSNTADILIIVGKTNRKALVSKLIDFEIKYITNNKLYKKLNKSFNIKIGKLNIPIVHINTLKHSTKKCAYLVSTLDIAKLLFAKLLNNSHILLLLNDLPDEYN